MNQQYKYNKEEALKGKYITFSMISPLLDKHHFDGIFPLGHSVKGVPIMLYQKGVGSKKVLMWSQMHGNESTTTKALFDVLNMIGKSFILKDLSIYFIPMLNPDGAERYTRVNANEVDLNRDAFTLSQPESQCLRKAYNLVQPDFCFNLHDQRTIFSAGKTKNPATVSFLAPSFNENRDINAVRQKAMEVIEVMNEMLQMYIPNQVGRFDDSFNINCTGDMYTYLGTPTILFESGFYPNDYNREETRKYIALSIVTALKYIEKDNFTNVKKEQYFNIPENDTLFFDVLLRDDLNGNTTDVGILFRENLVSNKIIFEPYIAEIGNLKNYYGHMEEKLSAIFTNKIHKKDIEKSLNLKKYQQKSV
ncbi:M14 metallopeptidase family protein [Capnocytophaga sp.]|uniref:M14 family metallopeptidase n=1 Tax=Capnocytophaga sp. TaxID=44737 RepID=UPI0026DD8BE8|nr:M14 metallopeptidase family protein [Capnocytophaga sp.]MDO5104962.1 M14 family metallopeptidase [Capnocytophaga sp.]